jgi:hypothetical protein
MTGGLANAMFIIAMGETWRKQGYNVVYSDMDGWFNKLANGFYSHSRSVREYKHIFENFDWDKYKVAPNIGFRNARLPFRCIGLKPQDGFHYIGYFQSEKYFYSNDFVKWLFLPSEMVKRKMSKYDDLYNSSTCSIHVRRGDYLKLPDHYPVPKMEYYNTAIERLNDKIDKFLIFSDDIEWCKNNFKGNKYHFIKDRDYLEFFLQSKCNHHIICNSSFGLLGALLGEQEDTIVYTPRVWFGRRLPVNHADDIVPDRYIKL